jgi:CRISPR/Cas system Type II protein with McrA/HNH and RuvC-like nuclease domain
MSNTKPARKEKPAKGARAQKWLGMNWITQQKRLAIYLRDGCACAYCGSTMEDGNSLSLDHIVPHSKGGTNHESNLVTCCSRCNSSRGNRSMPSFARAVASYVNHGTNAADIISHVRKCAKRSLTTPKAEAKILIARRGSAAKAVAAM